MKLLLENWRRYLKEDEEESYESKVVRLLMSLDPAHQAQGVYFLESGVVDKQEVLRLFKEAVFGEGYTERLKRKRIAEVMSSIEFDNDIFLALLEVATDPEGYLSLRRTQIKSLPAGLKVGGFLDLSYTPITSLPAGLEVGEDLDLVSTQITSLPAGLKVGGSLDLGRTQITSLPADLKVGGNLALHYTPITSLPAGLKVGWDLWLNGTQITSLPADLQVGGDIYGFKGKR